MDKIVKFFKENILDNRRNLYILIGVFVCLLILIFLLIFNNRNNNFTVTDSDAILIKKEYEKLNGVDGGNGKKYPDVRLDSNNKFVYTDVNEILDISNNIKDAVIYFGYPSCVYCRSAIQVLNDTVKDMDIDKILYFDTEKNDIDGLIEFLGEEYINEKDGKKEIYSPLVLFITDGKIVSHNKGTIFSHKDPYSALDEYQIKGLAWVYKQGLDNVVESMKLKKNS